MRLQIEIQQQQFYELFCFFMSLMFHKKKPVYKQKNEYKMNYKTAFKRKFLQRNKKIHGIYFISKRKKKEYFCALINNEQPWKRDENRKSTR